MANARRSPPEPTTPVTMEIFAHVQAGLNEDYALADLLVHEGVDPDRWARAEVTMRRRVAATPAARAEYETALVAAEDRFARTISPIDREPKAWLSFLDAYAAAPAPFTYLHKLGLRLADVARLRRTWVRRSEADPELDARMAELRKEKLPPLPKLVIGASPFVSSKGVARQAVVEQAPAPTIQEAAEIDGMGIDRLAALGAEIARAPRDRIAILGRYGLDERTYNGILVELGEALGRDPTLDLDYRRLLAHHEQRLRSAVATPDRAEKPRSGPIESGPDHGRALGARLAAQGLSLRGTSLAAPLPTGPALPFRAGEGGAPLASSEPPVSVRTPPRDHTGVRRATPELGGTSLAVEVPRSAALPFPQSAASRPPPPPPPPAPPASMGTGSFAPEPPPSLTLEQHVSITVDLALAPNRTAEVLRRYGLRADQKAALDAAFERRALANPALRSDWDRAEQAYRAWLAAKR